MSLPTAFHDLSADSFPFTIEMYDVDTGIVYSTETVEGPGAMYVPPKPAHVREAACRVRFANGMTADSNE